LISIQALKSLCEKNKGSSQDMAAMMLMLINFNNQSINIIAAISWLPPLISQLFSPLTSHSLAVFDFFFAVYGLL